MDRSDLPDIPAASPYYMPTKPIFQRHRLIFYIILFSVAIAVGMFADLPWMFVGLAITVKGLDLWLFRFRHGWRWRLTDKYLIAAGLAIFRIAFLDIHIKDIGWIDDIAMEVFMCTLGIIYPLLTTLEMGLMKLRLGRSRQAEVVDTLDSVLLELEKGKVGYPALECPVFRIDSNSGEMLYVCDEWFSRAAYTVGDTAEIRVKPERSTEIWDRKRVKDCLVRSWKFWLIYEGVILLFFFAMSRM